MQVEAVSADDFGGPGGRLDLDRLPGPPSTPFVGAYGNLARFFVNPMGYMDVLARGNYGDVVIFARGMRRGVIWPAKNSPGAVLLFGPKYMQQLLTDYSLFPESVAGRLPSEWGGAARLTSGLLWMHGERHRQHRRLIAPLYHQKRIQGYRDLMVSGINNMLDRLVPGESVDMIDVAGRLLVEYQNEAVLGVGGMDGLGRLGERMTKFFALMEDPGVYLFPLNLPFTPRRRLLDTGNEISRDLDRLIAAKRAAASDGDDVLSMMIRGRAEDGLELSEDELVSETGHLFVAGWVSTRSAVAFTSMLLAQHPQVASDLYDELTSVLHGEAPTIEQLKQLPLLDAVIKESLRLLPPVPFMSRATNDAVELGGYHLPPRTELYLSIYHVHRQPDVYPDPQRFWPERWLSISPSQYSYLPFGHGARVCPGMATASLQLRLLFAMLVQRYRLEMPRASKINLAGLAVLRPNPGLFMRVLKQDRQFTRSRGAVSGFITKMVDFA